MLVRLYIIDCIICVAPPVLAFSFLDVDILCILIILQEWRLSLLLLVGWLTCWSHIIQTCEESLILYWMKLTGCWTWGLSLRYEKLLIRYEILKCFKVMPFLSLGIHNLSCMVRNLKSLISSPFVVFLQILIFIFPIFPRVFATWQKHSIWTAFILGFCSAITLVLSCLT